MLLLNATTVIGVRERPLPPPEADDAPKVRNWPKLAFL